MPFGYEVRESEKKKLQEKSFNGYHKKYVDVDCTITANGKLIPRIIHFDDLHVYEIDKILDMRKAASLKVGGQGLRYTLRIQNKETYLFFDEMLFKFFIEAKSIPK